MSRVLLEENNSLFPLISKDAHAIHNYGDTLSSCFCIFSVYNYHASITELYNKHGAITSVKECLFLHHIIGQYTSNGQL